LDFSDDITLIGDSWSTQTHDKAKVKVSLAQASDE